jgi:hypothetical protein
MHDWSK